MKKFLFLLVFLAFLGLIGWQVYEKLSASKEKGNSRRRRTVAVAVETTPVQKAAIRDVGLFTGTLHPKSKFIVAPKIGGRLEKLNANIGDRVKSDQLVAELESDEYVQQVDQARAELDVARANLEESRSALDNAQRELGRVKALRKKKIASESELDAAGAEFRSAEAKNRVAQAQVAQKRAALNAAKVRLSYTKICVVCEDARGIWVVGERFVDEGAMLSPGSPIVSVLNIGYLIAVIHVIEKDYPKVRVDQTATVTTDAFPDRTFTGRIRRLAPLIKESSREARVEIEIPNQEALLKPGMFVRVQIEFATHPDATVISQNALVRRNGRQGVFLVDSQNMKARFIPVTVGIINGDLAEIVKPPLTGKVVTLGQHFLEDGSAIILPQSEGTGPPGGKPGGKGGQKKGKAPMQS